jgi:hypothetical protein
MNTREFARKQVLEVEYPYDLALRLSAETLDDEVESIHRMLFSPSERETAARAAITATVQLPPRMLAYIHAMNIDIALQQFPNLANAWTLGDTRVAQHFPRRAYADLCECVTGPDFAAPRLMFGRVRSRDEILAQVLICLARDGLRGGALEMTDAVQRAMDIDISFAVAFMKWTRPENMSSDLHGAVVAFVNHVFLAPRIMAERRAPSVQIAMRVIENMDVQIEQYLINMLPAAERPASGSVKWIYTNYTTGARGIQCRDGVLLAIPRADNVENMIGCVTTAHVLDRMTEHARAAPMSWVDFLRMV